MWPLALDVDTTIARLAPCDLRRGSTIAFLEAQWIRDPHGAWGMRVLYATADRTTNYAWEPHLALPPGDVPLGGGIGLNKPAQFRRSVFELDGNGLHIDVDLTDAQGHRLVWKVRQRRPWRGFDFLAPPAAGIENPTSLFFPYLRQFSFAPQPIEFSASFDDEPLTLVKLPFPWAWRRAVAQKAALGNVIVELLKDGAPPLTAADPGVDVDDDGRCRSVTRSGGVLPVVLSLDPPLPAGDALGAPHASAWRLVVGKDVVMGGIIRLQPGDAAVDVDVAVTRGWRGVPDRGWAWPLTAVIPMLRRWPVKYSWSGTLTHDGQLTGRWINAKPVR